ncbi:beta-lactamase regulator AmpE [Candidatus Colwellia aromaticivorans]|uniref:beta-lactamase regulator AmpE n=1 Tax=Candidatus Colwellia aromaticivorans TaxID=2267621 RepID=UPI000DF2AF9E|nr:beta-lactamase regulator AmpE [Candidatus Colwellia aromaticivorans]
MSLLSLLIALAAEKSLTSSLWRFDYYYQKYASLFQRNKNSSTFKGSTLSYTVFLLLPVALIHGLLLFVGDGLLHFIISTLVLIVCFGCFTTRHSYKQYLHAAFRGEETTSEMFHQQLLQDKNLPSMGFGQALIWLNYRYYIAIMLFFTLFGAAGVVFYRLLTTVIEQQNGCSLDQSENSPHNDNQYEAEPESNKEEKIIDEDDKFSIPSVSSGCKNYHNILFYLDWLPVRITSFGYMFVGHFSKALPMWLESFFDVKKPTHEILTDVAQKSEDIMVDKDDCTAEPCLLVRLSKRNVLLLLATIATLTLFGVIR